MQDVNTQDTGLSKQDAAAARQELDRMAAQLEDAPVGAHAHTGCCGEHGHHGHGHAHTGCCGKHHQGG